MARKIIAQEWVRMNLMMKIESTICGTHVQEERPIETVFTEDAHGKRKGAERVDKNRHFCPHNIKSES